MALPTHLGGLGILNPVQQATKQHTTSHIITAPLVNQITEQSTSETMSNRTANVKEGTCLNIKAQGFWGNDRQCAFFDIRVFNPQAHTYCSLPMATWYRRNEQEKRRAYDERVREVEHGCFSPPVFSVSGSMGPTARVVHKKLATMITSKHNQSYSQTMNWLRCRLSFSLLRSSIMCLRGSRSSVHHPAHPQI